MVDDALGFFPLLQELSGTYQTFEVYSSLHVRTLALMHARFDIVATPSNTTGMTTSELSEKTLASNGTLTGV